MCETFHFNFSSRHARNLTYPILIRKKQQPTYYMKCFVASILAGVAASSPSLGPVVGGYDVVEFHNLQATDDGVLGSSAFTHDLLTEDLSPDSSKKMKSTNWTFHFKNKANQELFAADPWAYAPRYGGF